jgi:hypothetical protein
MNTSGRQSNFFKGEAGRVCGGDEGSTLDFFLERFPI